jgi:hypothetical protein
MHRYLLTIIISCILIIALSQISQAIGFYSKPEFRGRVIDAETKQPIAGTVVVVLYKKWEFGGPGGGNTVTMDAKETLTDKNGEFYFPSYRTMIGPLSRERVAEFIIFKPGYKSVMHVEGIKIPNEVYFTVEKDMIGKEAEIKFTDRRERQITYKGILGIVELKRAKTSEERSKGTPDRPTGYTSRDLPLLFKAVNEDRKERGLEGEVQ